MGVLRDSGPPALDACTLRRIQHAARYRASHAGLTPEDAQDLAQDLVVHAVEQWSRYDASRGGEASFLRQVVEHKAADLLKARRADCRSVDQQLRSLGETITTAEGEQLSLEEAAQDDALRVQLGLRPPPSPDALAERIDFLRGLASLTPSQQELCVRVLHASSLREVAQEIGVSRAALYKALAKMRRDLLRVGILSHLRRRG